MTVPTTNNTVVFNGNGVTTVFPFGFPFKANGDIKLYSKDASGVVQPVLSGFTLTGAGSPNGGTVTMAAAPATGTKLVIAREMVIKQLIDLRNQGKFFPETHEEAFDILTMLIQQVSERVDRAVKVDISGDSNPDALIQGINNVAAAAQASASASASSAAAASGSASAAGSSAGLAQSIADSLTGSAVPLFAVQWWPSRASIPAGYAPADGQALPRATFPDAWAGIQAGNVPTVAEATWQSTPAERGKYTAADGTTNFRLPDYNGKAAGSLGAVFLRGDGALSAGVAGAIQLDEIKAHTHGLPGNTANGTADGSADWNTGYTTASSYSTASAGGAETRPLNVTGCWVIKLFGAVTNTGSADAAQLATDYAALAALVGAGPKLTKEYVSPPQAIVAGGLITLSHGLGAIPKSVALEYVCVTASEGFSPGDVVDFSNVTYIHTSANALGFGVTKTASQLLIRVGANGPAFFLNKSTGVQSALANIAPNFRLVARAMA